MKVVIHALHMLRPVPVLIRIPGQRFYGQFKLPADLRQFPASPLDVLALHVLLLAGKLLPLPVLPVTFAVGAFLVVVPPADGLQQLVHVVGFIDRFRPHQLHRLQERRQVRVLVRPGHAPEGPAGQGMCKVALERPFRNEDGLFFSPFFFSPFKEAFLSSRLCG